MNDKQRIQYLKGILVIIRNAKGIDYNNIPINNLHVSALYNENETKLKQRFNLVLDNNDHQYKKYNLIFCLLFISIFISSYMFTFKPIYYPNEDFIFMEEEDFIYERNDYILEIKNKE